MRRYRTEIVIPTDRCLTVQLPEALPTGRATLIIHADESPEPSEAARLDETNQELDSDHDDIEWWEEFEGELVQEPAASDDEAEADESPTPPAAPE